MKATTKIISATELAIGDIVHFYGARFEITSADLKKENMKDLMETEPYFMVANGKWIDGAIINGYFGPDKDWNFQGNRRARMNIEIAA